METLTIKQFEDRSNIEIIEELMKQNHGYITSRMLTDLGIHRGYLKIMCEKNIIEKITAGIYIDKNVIEDFYYVLSIDAPNVIYSHMTALYFHGLSIKAPNDEYDLTIPNKYHNPKIKTHNLFYVSKDIYNLGVTEIETPLGNKVKVYDKERCICDIIRSKKRMDFEHVKYSIKEYLKRKDKNLNKLSEYAEKMGIKKEVLDFVSMLYE